MSGFKFSMESISKYRQNIEDQKKEELAKALSLANQEEEKLTLLSEKRQKCLQDKIVDINLMRQQHAYITAIDTKLQKQKACLQKAEEAVKEKRADLNGAAVDCKIMDNYREKCVTRYNDDFLHEEQKFFDELGVIAFNHNAN